MFVLNRFPTGTVQFPSLEKFKHWLDTAQKLDENVREFKTKA